MDLRGLATAVFCGLAIDFAIYAALYIRSRLKPAPTDKQPPRPTIQVHFSPDDRQVCRRFLQGSCPQGDACPLTHQVTLLVHMVRFLAEARRTVDVCLYLMTCPELVRTLIDRCRDGVTVRLIVEVCNADDGALQVRRLRSCGVEIRTNSPTGLMHHKFAVVDGRKVITGSLNWTHQAVSTNWENVVVSDEPEMVRPFAAEFQRLWDLFVPLPVVHNGSYFFASHLNKFTKKKLMG